LPTQKARDLLAYLITFRHRPHPRSVLVGILWPQLPEAKARRRLSDILWRIRRVVGESVAADDERIWLIVDRALWLDVDDFVAHTEIVQTQEPITSEEIHQLRQAVDLYRGDFLDGFYQDWVLLERERLRGRYLRTLERLLSYHKQTTNYRAALRVARRLAAVEPLHEAAHREVMRLYHLLGRDAEAIAQYERCQRILREEMDLDPAPETVALYETLQANAPGAPQPSIHLPTAARHPVRDLDDLPLVGRDEERAALLGHLESAAAGQGGMVLLEGEPGIGKSRLARELIAGARWRDIAIAFAAAGESVTSSYALLQSLLTEALSSLRMRQLMHLMDPDTLQALAPLFPSLAPEAPDRPPELAHVRHGSGSNRP
jgi:DNA-binding SARP family transcriptional activator